MTFNFGKFASRTELEEIIDALGYIVLKTNILLYKLQCVIGILATEKCCIKHMRPDTLKIKPLGNNLLK